MAERHSQGFFDALDKETDMTEIDILNKKLEIAEKALNYILEGEHPDEAQAAAEHALSEMSELDWE